jgi:hypothetical protein
VAGDFDSLPVIDNGEEFLASILAAYRQEVPEGINPPAPTSRATLDLDADERLRIQTHVRDLRLKRKIQDTLLVPGMQAPGSKHWQGMADDSRSAVDFAVVCELIRKEQTFEQVEQIFAGTEIGSNRYLARDRHHSTGYAYLRTTYDNALREIEQQRKNSRVAVGQNFEVREVVRIRRNQKVALYRMLIQFTITGRDPFVKRVDIPADILILEDRFTREVFNQANAFPVLSANHKGKHNYPAFAQAVADMVTEDQKTPASMTREGHMALELWAYMRPMMARVADPASLGEVMGLGWRIGDTYYLKIREVYRKLQSMRVEFHHEDLEIVLPLIGEFELYVHQWQDGGEPEHMVKVTRASRQQRALPALPPAP